MRELERDILMGDNLKGNKELNNYNNFGINSLGRGWGTTYEHICIRRLTSLLASSSIAGSILRGGGGGCEAKFRFHSYFRFLHTFFY